MKRSKRIPESWPRSTAAVVMVPTWVIVDRLELGKLPRDVWDSIVFGRFIPVARETTRVELEAYARRLEVKGRGPGDLGFLS